MHHIYKITNLINGKIYIGQARNVAKRWSDHRAACKHNRPTQAIHRAFIKYGLENFTFEVIASCKTQDDVNEIETICVKQYDSYRKGYNNTNGGSNAPKTEEWKAKVSELAKSRAETISEQMREIAAQRPDDYYDYMKNNKINEGRKQSEEWREMMRNRPRTEEENLKRSQSLKESYANGERTSYFRENEPWNKGKITAQVAWNKGKETSKEVKEKISKANKGKPAWNKGLPPEQQSRFGATLTDEHKQILREANKKKRILTDEQVKSIREEYAADPSRGKQTRLAKKYGVKQQLINKIIVGKSYKD